MIDLHTHTTKSDGSYTPSELIKLAAEVGLEAIAITDHDTCEGHEEAFNAGVENHIEVIPGVELNTGWHSTAIHILGYYIDPCSVYIQKLLEEASKNREIRNLTLIEYMKKDGLPISYSLMKAQYGEIIGRPHFAQFLVNLGLATDISNAFQKYLGRNCPYYVEPTRIPVQSAIEAIKNSGGIPVIAHPFQYKLSPFELNNLISDCVKVGVRGMECIYTGYDTNQVNYLLSLTKKYNIFPTGGSDFHGTPKPNIKLGKLNVPYSYLQNLKNN